MTWPFRGDGPIARARKVAHAYRAALVEHAPDAANALDARMRAYGQTWAVPTLATVEPDDWLDPMQAANLAGVEVGTLREWRRRGVITGRRNGRTWEYRAGDVLDAVANTRHRGTRRTETA